MIHTRSLQPRLLFIAVLLFSALSGGTLVATGIAETLDLLALDDLAVTLTSMTPPLATAMRRRRGRPRKFPGPTRAVTLTLPEDVLETLGAIHPDPSRAVVQLARRRTAVNHRPAAELAVFGKRAVITIRPTPSLEKRTGVDLVPLPDGRALISFEQPQTVADLELMLYDALDDPTLNPNDRKVFESIGAILKQARQSTDVTLLRRSIIVLESSNGSRAAKAKARPAKKR